MDLLRTLIAVIAGAIVIGLILAWPLMIAGWVIGGMVFGGGSFGKPGSIGIYAGMVAAPTVGAFLGFTATRWIKARK